MALKYNGENVVGVEYNKKSVSTLIYTNDKSSGSVLGDYLSYNLVNDEYYEVGLSNKSVCPKEVIIPFEFNSKPIKAIKQEGFKGAEMRKLTLSSNINLIGVSAFENCKELIEVKFNKPSNTDGWKVQYNGSAFKGCEKLAKINFPTKNEFHYATFENCKSLQGCISFKGSTTIGGRAFANCEGIEGIILGKGVSTLGFNAFFSCNNLKFADLQLSSATSIPSGIFENCTNLTWVTLPHNVTSIERSAFANTNLISLDITSDVTQIDGSAFKECRNLKWIVIPNTVGEIGTNAFSECNNLATVYYKGTSNKWDDIEILGGNDLLKNATRYYYKDRIGVLTAKDKWTYVNYIPTEKNHQCRKDGHSMSDSTCNAPQTCSVCEATYRTPAGHSWKEATCTDPETCSRCGETVGEALEHLWETTVTPGTCTTPEITVKTCTREGCGAKNTSRGEVKGHSLGEAIITKPTCTENGTETATCEVCGETVVTPISATGHTMGEWVVTKYPTCTEEGIETNTCHCGESVERSSPATGHIYGDWAYNADTGNEERKCQCGDTQTQVSRFKYKLLSNKTYSVAANENAVLPSVVTIPSKYNNIKITQIADKGFFDRDEIETLVIPEGVTTIGKNAAINCNNLTEIVIPSTCTTFGNSFLDECPKMKRVYYGGTESQWLDKILTFMAAGLTSPSYTRYYYSKYIPEDSDNKYWYFNADGKPIRWGDNPLEKAFRFKFEQEGNEARSTYTVWGNVQNKLPTEIKIPKTYKGIAVTHIGESAFQDWDGDQVIIPDSIISIERGAFYRSTVSQVIFEENSENLLYIDRWAFRYCKKLKNIDIPESVIWIDSAAFEGTPLEKVVISQNVTKLGSGAFAKNPAEGRIYVRSSKKPAGWADDWCDDTYTVEWGYSESECLHDWSDWATSVLPTCTEDGAIACTCNTCGTERTKKKPAKGHTYSKIVYYPTCVKDGYTVHTCSVCGDKTRDSYTSALGHQENEWEVTITPTCSAKGRQLMRCKRCNTIIAEETLPIDPNGHVYGEWVTIAEPTCDYPGTRKRTCKFCGQVDVDENVFATGHDWDTEVTITPPTCNSWGWYTYTCNYCGETQREIYAQPLGHTPRGEGIVTPPTCTSEGYTTDTCSVCGKQYEYNETEMVDHTPSGWIVDVEPTLYTEGSKHKECVNCGEILVTESMPKLEETDNYILTESGDFLTDEEGNKLIIEGE